MSVQNLDIQVNTLYFAVDRPPNPDWKRINAQNQDWYVLAYAVNGSVEYRFEEISFVAKKGNVIFIKQGQQYSAISNPEDPWRFISVAFSMNKMDTHSHEVLDNLPNIFVSSDSTRMWENFAELNRIWTTKEVGYLIKCRSLILDILYILLTDEYRKGKTSVHYTKIQQVIDMMRNNIACSYSLPALYTMTGLSSSYFRLLFKEMTGMSPIQFQNQLKIDHAKDLILSHTCNVSEAAQAVGFHDVYYFSKMFRKITGKNPSEYLHVIS